MKLYLALHTKKMETPFSPPSPTSGRLNFH